MIRQALHILRKDIRSQRAPLACVVVLAALHVWFFAPGHRALLALRAFGDLVMLAPMFLPLASAFVVVMAIHNEPVVGDRQFWVSRPYRRDSLFLAKALFILIALLVPLFVADVLILVENGIPPTPHLDALVWKNAIALVWLALPVMALASISANLASFAFIGGLIAMSFFAASSVSRRSQLDLGRMQWQTATLVTSALLVCVTIILLLQYRWKLTRVSYIAIGVFVLSFYPLTQVGSWDSAIAIQAWFATEPDAVKRIRVSLGEPSKYQVLPSSSIKTIQYQIPLKVEGLASDQMVEWHFVDLTAVAGTRRVRADTSFQFGRPVSAAVS